MKKIKCCEYHTLANFIKLFWQNFHNYWHVDLSFKSGYTARGVNYAEAVRLSVVMLSVMRKAIFLIK
jgi:hypothetical protein